jgi:hypothetical protein
MARKAITDLTSATTIANTDLFVITTGVGSSPETKSITANLVFQYIVGRSSSISNGTSNVFITGASGNVKVSSTGNTWIFATTGKLIFPDSTIQSTAFNTTTSYTLSNNQIFSSNVTINGNLSVNANVSVTGLLSTVNATVTGLLSTVNATVTGLFSVTPATQANNATGTAGQISWDTDYIYVCIATNMWKRVALTDYQ